MLPPSEIARRLGIADQVIARGGNLSRFAEALEMTNRGAWRFLESYGPDRRAKLVANPGHHEMSRSQVLARLLLIKVHREFRAGQGRLAKALGISSAALTLFVDRVAPDGLDAAIADLWPGDDPPIWPARAEAAHG